MRYMPVNGDMGGYEQAEDPRVKRMFELGAGPQVSYQPQPTVVANFPGVDFAPPPMIQPGKQGAPQDGTGGVKGPPPQKPPIAGPGDFPATPTGPDPMAPSAPTAGGMSPQGIMPKQGGLGGMIGGIVDSYKQTGKEILGGIKAIGS